MALLPEDQTRTGTYGLFRIMQLLDSLISLVTAGGFKVKTFFLPTDGTIPTLSLASIFNTGGAVADYKYIFGGNISSADIIANVVDDVVILKQIRGTFRVVNADANTITVEGFYIFITNGSGQPSIAYVQLEQTDTLLTGTNKTFQISTFLPLNNGQSQNTNLLEIPFRDFTPNSILNTYSVFVKISGAANVALVTVDSLASLSATVIGRTL